jgi:hypothetical protein
MEYVSEYSVDTHTWKMSITPTRRHRPRGDSDERVCTWTWDDQVALLEIDLDFKRSIVLREDPRTLSYLKDSIDSLRRRHPLHHISPLKEIDLRYTSHHENIQRLTHLNECIQRASRCAQCPSILPSHPPPRTTGFGMPRNPDSHT